MENSTEGGKSFVPNEVSSDGNEQVLQEQSLEEFNWWLLEEVFARY